MDVGHYFVEPRKNRCALFVFILVIFVSFIGCRFTGIGLKEPS